MLRLSMKTLAVFVLAGAVLVGSAAGVAAQECGDLTIFGVHYTPLLSSAAPCNEDSRRFHIHLDVLAAPGAPGAVTCATIDLTVFEIRAFEGGGPGSSVVWNGECGPALDTPIGAAIVVPIFPSGSYSLELWRIDPVNGDTSCQAITDGAVEYPPCPYPFIRMDANNDGQVDISDAVWSINALFSAGVVPACADAVDANDDGLVNIADGIATLQFLFQQGPPPPAPGTTCGLDPTDDDPMQCFGPTVCP